MIAFRSTMTTVVALMGCIALPASSAMADATTVATGPLEDNIDSSVTDPLQKDPFEEFRRSQIDDPETNLLLQFPSMTDAQFFDINLDGEIDGDDLGEWLALAKVELLDDENRVISFEYNTGLDVNEDGFVDALDQAVLKLGIARAMADRDEELIFGGAVVSPDRVPVAFDGVFVTFVWPSETPPSGMAAAGDGGSLESDGEAQGPSSAPKEVANPQNANLTPLEECPGGVLKYDNPYGAVPTFSREWNSWGGACGGTTWVESVSATPFFHGTGSSNLACGTAGPEVQTYTITRTTSTTLSLSAKAGFDEFGSSLGITWAATSSVTITQGSKLTHESNVRFNDTLSRRFKGYEIRFIKTRSSGDSGCHWFLSNIDESDRVYTMNSQTKTKRVTCPGCFE